MTSIKQEKWTDSWEYLWWLYGFKWPVSLGLVVIVMRRPEFRGHVAPFGNVILKHIHWTFYRNLCRNHFSNIRSYIWITLTNTVGKREVEEHEEHEEDGEKKEQHSIVVSDFRGSWAVSRATSICKTVLDSSSVWLHCLLSNWLGLHQGRQSCLSEEGRKEGRDSGQIAITSWLAMTQRVAN